MATTVPAPADNAQPDAALTGFRLGIQAGLHQGTLRARYTAIAEHAAATTGCPLPDCLTNHTDGHTGHYTPNTHAGPVTVALDLDDDGTASITLTQGGHTERLDLDETGALMAALAAHHARMTALHTELTAHRTAR